MAFLVETHMHTAQVSPCSRVPAREAMAQYRRAGFDAVIVTDHLRDDVLEAYPGNRRRRIDRWLEGYRQALSAGGELGLAVWLGVEITFTGSREDFLVYGIGEDFLRRHADLTVIGLPALRETTRREGLLLVQAHPFRPYAGAAEPRFLDGVEILNGNPRQQSNNDAAGAFCRRHGLIGTGGSDYHQPQDLSAGMEFDRALSDIGDFVRALRRREGRVVEISGQERPVPSGAKARTGL